MSDEHSIKSPRWYRTRNGQLLLAALGVAGLYLLSEHWEHALAYLPWLVILACPLLHVFMHGGHGGHGGGPTAQGAPPLPRPGAGPDAGTDSTPDARR